MLRSSDNRHWIMWNDFKLLQPNKIPTEKGILLHIWVDGDNEFPAITLAVVMAAWYIPVFWVETAENLAWKFSISPSYAERIVETNGSWMSKQLPNWHTAIINLCAN